MKIYIVNGDWSKDWGIWNAIDFLWHKDQDVDTDGVDYAPGDLHWMEMSVSNREHENEWFHVDVSQEEPRIVVVEGFPDYLCYRAAYFLAIGSGGQIAFGLRDAPQDAESLREMMGEDFDVDAAKKRAFGNSALTELMLEGWGRESNQKKFVEGTALDQE